MDSDKNGMISSSEYKGYRYQGHSSKPMGKQFSPHRTFKDMDTNKDSKISIKERNAARMKWFNGMDVNGDKVVTPEEVTQAKEKRDKKSKK